MATTSTVFDQRSECTPVAARDYLFPTARRVLAQLGVDINRGVPAAVQVRVLTSLSPPRHLGRDGEVGRLGAPSGWSHAGFRVARLLEDFPGSSHQIATIRAVAGSHDATRGVWGRLSNDGSSVRRDLCSVQNGLHSIVARRRVVTKARRLPAGARAGPGGGCQRPSAARRRADRIGKRGNTVLWPAGAPSLQWVFRLAWSTLEKNFARTANARSRLSVSHSADGPKPLGRVLFSA